MTVIGAVFLVVSAISLTMFAVTLTRLIAQHAARSKLERIAYRGLLRTAACRVGAAVLYVGLGVATVTLPPGTGALALLVFVITQMIWQVNAVLDVLLRRRLAAAREEEPPP